MRFLMKQLMYTKQSYIVIIHALLLITRIKLILVDTQVLVYITILHTYMPYIPIIMILVDIPALIKTSSK